MQHLSRPITLAVASDSFKGSLTSREVAEGVAEAISATWPEVKVLQIPIADGGEGSLDALREALGAAWCDIEAHDPLMRPIQAHCGYNSARRLGIVELAEASGLVRLRPEERNPLKTTTFGTGELMASLLERGATEILLTLGGSATHDCATGLLRALGYRFLDGDNRPLTGGGEVLEQIHRIDASQSHPRLKSCRLRIACDVENPLIGELGAAAIYAPQKGADPAMVARLEAGSAHFVRLIEQQSGREVAHLRGGGAAGGVAGALVALLGAELQGGVELLLDRIHFEEQIAGCDLIITGEGRIDRQTLMGKAPMGVLRVAQKLQIPTLALCGVRTQEPELDRSGFEAIWPITPEGTPTAVALEREFARHHLQRTACEAFQAWLEKKF